ncbi:hypothetical protein [Massilia rubra]|nr:hypothetical protein [Massilia rubra]
MMQAKLGASRAKTPQLGAGARDDALVMRHLVPGWRVDSRRPCLVR